MIDYNDWLNNGLIDLRSNVNRKQIPENENPKKLADVVKKIIDFKKWKKGQRTKMLIPKQMLQRLPIELKKSR